MAWTTPRTWVAGEVVTAAIMNTHVRDNDAYLYAHASSIDGVINSGGTIAAGTGFSVSGHTTGNYTIAFTVALSAAPEVFVTPTVVRRFCGVTARSTTGFTVGIQDETLTAVDTAFSFLAKVPA